MDFKQIQQLVQPTDTKILLLVMDGLGDLPKGSGCGTPLEEAATPNLNTLAANSICGLHQPVGPGITPGSGQAHLTLFGYDPFHYQVGRGMLAALGIEFDLKADDLAARANFCTIDENGQVVDRRAGRIETSRNRELCKKLRDVDVPGVEISIEPVKEYRLAVVFRGQGLCGDISDTDPQTVGQQPKDAMPGSPQAEEIANLINEFIKQARSILSDHHPANMVLLRGFSQLPEWPKMPDIYGLQPAAIAGYPMYRGVSRLVGMKILKTADNLDQERDTLERHWNDFDFFFLHVKQIDSAGEDGDFDHKVELIEEVDEKIPRVLDLEPDVVVITGDHSTPAVLKSHNWHPGAGITSFAPLPPRWRRSFWGTRLYEWWSGPADGGNGPDCRWHWLTRCV